MGLARALSGFSFRDRVKSYKVGIDIGKSKKVPEKVTEEHVDEKDTKKQTEESLPAWLSQDATQNVVLKTILHGISLIFSVVRMMFQVVFKHLFIFLSAVLNTLLPKSHRERLMYKFDSWITKRSYQTIFLLLMMVTWMFVGGLVYSTVNNGGRAGLVSEAMWQSWTFMADPGVHADVGDTCSGLTEYHARYSCLWTQRFLSLIIACGGIFFFSIVLGFVVDAIREKMDHLKKGKTRVLEYNHTLILGWTDKTVAIIKEIALANASEQGGVVVLMGLEDKEYLDNELREQLKPSDVLVEGSLTRVVTRTGSPLYASDLNKVSAEHAKSIIILANDQVEADRSDAQTLRAVLTLNGLATGIRGHIVAEVRDVDNEALVRLVGGDRVETIVSHDIVGRLMLMSVRQPGLAKVYESILGFDGDEFYTECWDELVGEKFGQVQPRFPDAIPIGIRKVDGTIMMNPPRGHVIARGEGIIVIAEDDDSYSPQEHPERSDWGLPPVQDRGEEKPPERILFCGWRRDIRDILILLDSMVTPGSELHMISEVRMAERALLLRESGLDVGTLVNLTIIHHFGNTAVRRHLEKLPMGIYTSVMIMADELKETDLMHSDSHTLATLLLLRDIQKSENRRRRSSVIRSTTVLGFFDKWLNISDSCPCVCEILDARTQRTIRANSTISMVSDFVQSNTLMSRVLAMVSEDRSVRTILDELLGAEGCGFSVKPSSVYCSAGEAISFLTLSMRARVVGDIIIGYQKKRSIDNTVINPKDKLEERDWTQYDMVLLTGQSRLFKADSVMGKVVTAFKSVLKRRGPRESMNQVQLLNSVSPRNANAPDINFPTTETRDDLSAIEDLINTTDIKGPVPKRHKSTSDTQSMLLDVIRRESAATAPDDSVDVTSAPNDFGKERIQTKTMSQSNIQENEEEFGDIGDLIPSPASKNARLHVATSSPRHQSQNNINFVSPSNRSASNRMSITSIMSTDLWELSTKELSELISSATQVIVTRSVDPEY